MVRDSATGRNPQMCVCVCVCLGRWSQRHVHGAVQCVAISGEVGLCHANVGHEGRGGGSRVEQGDSQNVEAHFEALRLGAAVVLRGAIRLGSSSQVSD